MKKSIILTAIMSLVSPYLVADIISDARALIDNSKFSEAKELLSEELEANPDSPNAGMMNGLLGEALFLTGDLDKAKEHLEIAKKRGVADASRWLGKIALYNYDFNSAVTLYDNYIKQKNTAKKPLDPNAGSERKGIEKAIEALDRVERLQIIDSLTVPKKEFFSNYRISAPSGRLMSPELSPLPQFMQDAEVVYINEQGDNMIWAMTDTIGKKSIVESIKLTDGNWHEPIFTPQVLNGNGDSDYPFMMPDGLTLYFSNNGEDSMGGYDIFIASRDAVDGTWLAPQNLGMPYNSPFDDYLLAIDEVTGVGWWATDRNLIPDHLTIYVFIPNDRRINIDSEEQNPIPYARISGIKLTQDEETDYQEILDAIQKIDPAKTEKEAEFNFRLPDGTLYTRFEQLPDEEMINDMKNYLDAKDFYTKSASQLDALRKDYHINGSTATLKLQISDLEASLGKQRSNLKKLKNKVISHSLRR